MRRPHPPTPTPPTDRTSVQIHLEDLLAVLPKNIDEDVTKTILRLRSAVSDGDVTAALAGKDLSALRYRAGPIAFLLASGAGTPDDAGINSVLEQALGGHYTYAQRARVLLRGTPPTGGWDSDPSDIFQYQDNNEFIHLIAGDAQHRALTGHPLTGIRLLAAMSCTRTTAGADAHQVAASLAVCSPKEFANATQHWSDTQHGYLGSENPWKGVFSEATATDDQVLAWLTTKQADHSPLDVAIGKHRLHLSDQRACDLMRRAIANQDSASSDPASVVPRRAVAWLAIQPHCNRMPTASLASTVAALDKNTVDHFITAARIFRDDAPSHTLFTNQTDIQAALILPMWHSQRVELRQATPCERAMSVYISTSPSGRSQSDPREIVPADVIQADLVALEQRFGEQVDLVCTHLGKHGHLLPPAPTLGRQPQECLASILAHAHATIPKTVEQTWTSQGVAAALTMNRSSVGLAKAIAHLPDDHRQAMIAHLLASPDPALGLRAIGAIQELVR